MQQEIEHLKSENRILKSALVLIASGMVKGEKAWELANAAISKIDQSSRDRSNANG